MKKTNIFLLGALVMVAVVVAVEFAVYMSGVVPYRKCSEVYKQYSKVEGVRATYVKDYRVNDTLTVGVTLLEATDSAGWAYLMESFHISEEMIKESEVNPLANIWVSQSLKGSPETRSIPSDSNSPADSDIEIVAKAMKERQICIFHTRGAGEREAIQNYHWDVTTKKRKH